jgi:rod shape determining protein RodA
MGVFGSQYSPDMDSSTEQRFDWVLVWSMLFIIVFGLINLYSATADPFSAHNGYFVRQMLFYGAGFIIIAVILVFDYRLFERIAYILYGLNIVALLATKYMGVMRNGARLWIPVGPIMYQPSETMKIMLILALAKYFYNNHPAGRMGLQAMFIPALMVLVPVVITVLQPDAGTGMHMFLTGFGIIFFAGIKRRIILTTVILGLISVPIAWKYALKEYQRDRIRIFIDPDRDPKNKGYNARQSLIAIGSGEVLGKGFRKGTQTQLDFTPEGHTDFIFTVLAEEWGLLGCAIFLAAYFIFIMRCINITSLCTDTFGLIISLGIVIMIVGQMTINLAMVMGFLPIVGIPLPLASYGGSSALNICASMGLILNVGYRRGIF